MNSPDVSTHETFSQRSEPQSSGLARILIKEDLRKIRRADLYTEIWGGHPGTENQRVNVNGRHQFMIPEVSAASYHCTHQYPSFQLSPNDLVNGYNALQFACDQGTTFWGHYIVDNACLRIGIDAEGDFETDVKTEVRSDHVRLSLSESSSEIASVTYHGRYFGYDENGNGHATDWHGMTKAREPHGMLGTVTKPPFVLKWDTSMLPTQDDVAAKAYVRLKARPNLVYETAMNDGITLKDRKVSVSYVTNLSTPFWSRNGKKITASFQLDTEPKDIDNTELPVVTGTRGSGNVKDYFTLNGTHLPVADGHEHAVNYSRIPVDRELLKKGDNELALLSDTKHHGIEILRPGPAMIIKRRR